MVCVFLQYVQFLLISLLKRLLCPVIIPYKSIMNVDDSNANTCFERRKNNDIPGTFVDDPKTTMMTSSNGNIFRTTGLFYGEFLRSWILGTKASDAEL